MKSLIRKQSNMLLGQIAISIISVLTLIIIARTLGAEAFGRIGIISGFIAIIATIQQLGFLAALNRHVASESSTIRQNQLLIHTIIFRIIVLVPLLVLLSFSAEAFLKLIYERPALSELLLVGLVALFFSEIQLLFETFFISINETKLAVTIATFLASMRLLAFLFWYDLTEIDYFIIISASAILGCTISLVSFHFFLKRRFSHTGLTKLKSTIGLLKEISSVSYGTKIIYAIWDKLPILLISPYVSDSVIGQLDLAMKISEKYRSIGASLSKINLAHITTSLLKSNIRTIKKPFQKNYLLLSSLFGTGVIITHFFAELIVDIFGKGSFPDTGQYLTYTITLSFIFLQINWVGSGILYPTKATNGLVSFHFITKSTATALMMLVLASTRTPQDITYILALMIITEAFSLFFYQQKGRQVGVTSFNRYTILISCTVFLSFYFNLL